MKVNNFGGMWEIKKFGYKLKQICSILTGIPVQDFEKAEVKDSYLGKEWDKVEICLNETFKGDAEEFTKFIKENDVRIVNIPTYEDGKNTCWSYIRNRKITKIKVRELLQKVGTEAMRNQIHENTWVNALFADYKIGKDEQVGTTPENLKWVKGDYPNWIITDCRFPNEAKAIKKRGGIVLRILRSETDKLAGDHPSETALDKYPFDRIILNNSTLKDLINQVERVLKHFEII